MLWTRFIDEAGCVPDPRSDSSLVEQLKRWDERAFLELYDRFGAPVYRFLMHMTGSAAVAEELTQEVFASVLEALSKGKFLLFDPGKGSVEGYLIGMARNLARKEFRQGRKTVSLETAEGEESIRKLCRHDQLLHEVLLRSDLARLQTAISELPLHYREALVLCCLQDWSYQRAGQLLKCSAGTVASRISRAKARLSAKLKNVASSCRSNESGTGKETDGE